jgi:hypothetical protein
MNLKPNIDRNLISAPTVAWGVVGDASEAVVRFECADATYSFPYHRLDQWALYSGKTERLTIRAAEETITIFGRELSRIRDALDVGRLKIVHCQQARYKSLNCGTIITNMIVESAKLYRHRPPQYEGDIEEPIRR